MSRFLLMHSTVSLHGNCKKLLCHHQKFLFIFFISALLKKPALFEEQVHFEISFKNTNMAL